MHGDTRAGRSLPTRRAQETPATARKVQAHQCRLTTLRRDNPSVCPLPITTLATELVTTFGGLGRRWDCRLDCRRIFSCEFPLSSHACLSDEPSAARACAERGGGGSSGKRHKTKLRIALAGGESETALEGALAISAAGLAEVVVLGDADKARALAERHAIALEEAGGSARGGVVLLDCPSDAASARAAEMANAGEVQIVMKGSTKTDVFMRALLSREGGIRVRGKRMVHVFYITPPSAEKEEEISKVGGIFLSDCAVNVKPDEATRQDCLRAVVSLAHGVGIVCPRVAILSATEKETASMPSSLEAGDLARWARETFAGQASIEGPLSLDVALVAQAVRVKGIEDSEVAGRADGMIVADIDVGNALFKALVWIGGGCSAGVVLGGEMPCGVDEQGGRGGGATGERRLSGRRHGDAAKRGRSGSESLSVKTASFTKRTPLPTRAPRGVGNARKNTRLGVGCVRMMNASNSWRLRHVTWSWRLRHVTWSCCLVMVLGRQDCLSSCLGACCLPPNAKRYATSAKPHLPCHII